MMLKAAGASMLSLPSNELYAAMQTGALDAAMTSSTSLISFRLEEVAKSLTTGRGKSYWFMLEPLMMSKQVFDTLPKEQQDAIMAVGAEMEEFGTEEAMADDQKVADVYAKKAGAKVADLDDATVEKWQAHRARHRLEGLRRQDRDCRPNCSSSPKASRVLSADAIGAWPTASTASRPQRRRRRSRAPPAASTARSRRSTAVVIVSSVALLVASLVLTYSVFVALFLASLDRLAGRDRRCSCIVGAVFMSARCVQAQRGHVGIEAIVELLPPRVEPRAPARRRPR